MLPSMSQSPIKISTRSMSLHCGHPMLYFTNFMVHCTVIRFRSMIPKTGDFRDGLMVTAKVKLRPAAHCRTRHRGPAGNEEVDLHPLLPPPPSPLSRSVLLTPAQLSKLVAPVCLVVCPECSCGYSLHLRNLGKGLQHSRCRIVSKWAIPGVSTGQDWQAWGWSVCLGLSIIICFVCR